MKIDVASLQHQFGVTTERLARAINRPMAIVEDWQSGPHSAPTYIALTIEAVANNVKPADNATMHAAPLVELLGVSAAAEHYWKDTLQFPQAARIAVAWSLIKRGDNQVVLSQYDLDVLKRLNEAVHYRAPGGWRARPVMGKPYPTIRKETPSRLIRAGLIKAYDNPPRLVLTQAGKAKLYR